MSLLTTSNPKTAKGEGLGYLTAVLHLAPATAAGIVTRSGKLWSVCPWATAGCIAGCLNHAGRGGMVLHAKRPDGFINAVQAARARRTREFFADRAGFLVTLDREIAAHVRRAERHGLKPAVRLNATSDIPWEGVARELLARWRSRGVVFYDYTKSPERAIRQPYHLTFSRSESNDADCERVLDAGGTVAVVFSTRKGESLPATFRGREVIDADEHDLRFLDPRGVWAGLRAKGPARKDASGFVVQL